MTTQAQRKITTLVLVLWAVSTVLFTLWVAPAVVKQFNLHPVIGYGLSMGIFALAVGFIHLLPIMLGAGVLLFPRRWLRASDYCVDHDVSIYKAYLIVQLKPYCIVFGVWIAIIAGILFWGGKYTPTEIVPYIIEGSVNFTITFLLAVGARIGYEYTDKLAHTREMRSLDDEQ